MIDLTTIFTTVHTFGFLGCFLSVLWLILPQRTLSNRFIQLIHRILVHARHHMRVDVQRHTDLTMPKNFLHHLRMHAKTEKKRCGAVTQVVKADIRQIRPLQKDFQLIEHVPRRIQVRSQRCTEDIVVFLPVDTGLLLFFRLTCTMLFERCQRKGCDDNCASALLRFRLRFFVAFTGHLAWNPRKHSTYLQFPPLKINILPFQPHDLSASHTSSESEFKESPQAVPLYC